jgi:hypothetical protein
MEKLSILLIALFLILCLGQLYFVEPFAEADIKNATVTMSLSDMLFYGGSVSNGAPVQRPEYGQYKDSNGDMYGNDLGSYLYLKNEMTRQFKEHIKQTQADPSFQSTNVEPPSCMQGSSYMETVPLKVPASCSQ